MRWVISLLIRMRRVTLLIACMLLALVLGSGVALAALSNQADAATIKVNGRVWSIVAAGDRIYLGGAFTQITDKAGTIHKRNNLAAIDADTKQVTAWNPTATYDTSPSQSQVRAMVLSPDGTRLLVGGKFTRVGGLARNKLAAINLATGLVDSQWNAGSITGGSVWALAASGSRLYAGGDFTGVAGQPRERLAAVSATTGALDTTWKPRAHRGDAVKPFVRALDLSPDGNTVYAGGNFNHISGQRTGKLVALEANNTGARKTTFNPQQFDDVLAIDVAGGSVFVACADPLEGVESFNATTGAQNWRLRGGHPAPEAGDAQAIKAVVDSAGNGKVYIGGHFAQMYDNDGTTLLTRRRLMEADAKTGKIGPWAPNVPWDGNLGVWALEVDRSRGRLYAGGDFTHIGGQEHIRFAKFSGLPGLR